MIAAAAEWLWDDRLVEVWGAPDRAGSGVAFGATGVLTARHVVSAGPAKVLARAVLPSPGIASPTGRGSTGAAPWVAMRVVADVPDWDLAVLDVDPQGPGGWLVPASAGPRIVQLTRAAEPACETVGFPNASAPIRAGVPAAERVRQSEQAAGILLPAGHAKPRTDGASRPVRVMPLDVVTASPHQVAQWGGMSGAGVVLADGRLAGIVVEVEPGRQARRLLVVPLAEALAASQRLREAIEAVSGGPVVVEMRHADRARRLPSTHLIEQFQVDHLAIGGDAAIPFGGRDDELDRLSRWAQDPAGPARFVVSAPPGRGKSTLLTRWWQRYRDGPAVFVPITISFGMDTEDIVLRALVARLAEAHREDPAEASAGASVDELRDGLADYLARPAPAGHPLLIIVDGLDEAVGWDPASVLSRPRRLGPGVRLLIAARQTEDAPNATAWCERLGCAKPGEAATMDLHALTEPGVGQAVDSMRPALTPAQVGTLRPLLFDLTSGDPLVLRLYLEDLAEAADRDGWIATLTRAGRPPGLDGYLRCWIADQERLWGGPLGSRPRDIGVVFSVLACAFGPLSRDQLRRLTARRGVTGGDALDAALAELRRFVLTDPVADSYAISHPLIAEWRRTALARNEELAEYDLLYADHYGSSLPQWTEREWLALDAYALRHLTAHLCRAGRPELLDALLRREWPVGDRMHNGWYYAKSSAGQLDAYLTDVAQAWRLAGDLADEARYALYVASIPAATARVPGRLLEMCVRFGVLSWRQAIDAAHARREPRSRAAVIAGLLPLIPRPAREEAVRVELWVARQCDDYERGLILSELAATAPETVASEILAAAGTLVDDRDLERIVTGVAARLSDVDLPAAAHVAGSIDDPLKYVRALAAIAARAPEPVRGDLIADMRDEIGTMRDEIGDVEELCETGLALCALASVESDPAQSIRDVVGLAERLDDLDLPEVLTALARLEPGDDLLDGLLDLAERIYRDKDSEATDLWYLRTLVGVAPHLSPTRRAARVGRFVDQLLGYTNPLATWFGGTAVAVLATLLPPERRHTLLSGRIGATVSTAVGTGILASPWLRDAALAVLADLPPDRFDVAVRATDEVIEHEPRAAVLAVLLPQLDERRCTAILGAELARVQAIHDELYQAHALAALAQQLPEPQRAHLAAEAVERGGPLLRDKRHAELIGTLAPHLVGDAFDAVCGMDDGLNRSRLLAALVEYLPAARLPEVETIAEGLRNDRYLVLAALAARRHAGADDALHEAVALAVEMYEDFLFVLERLAADLTDAGRRAALEVVEELGRTHSDEAAQALVLLAPHLRGTEQEAAVAVAGRLEGPAGVAALAGLGSDMARDAAARLTGDDRGEAMAVLARFPQDRPAALASALAVRNDLRRSEILARIAPYLDGHARDEALAAMLRCYAAPGMSASLRLEMLRATLLDRIADTAGLLGEQVASDVARAVLDAARWWP